MTYLHSVHLKLPNSSPTEGEKPLNTVAPSFATSAGICVTIKINFQDVEVTLRDGTYLKVKCFLLENTHLLWVM